MNFDQIVKQTTSHGSILQRWQRWLFNDSSEKEKC